MKKFVRTLFGISLVLSFSIIPIFAAGISGNIDYTYTYHGDIDRGYHDFYIPGTSYHGLCCDPKNTAGRGTASVQKLSNTSNTARVAYYYGIQKGWMNGSASGSFENMILFLRMVQYTIRPSDVEDMVDAETLQDVRNGINAVRNVNVPNSFEIYRCYPSDGTQEFTLWKINPTGYVKVHKISGNTSVTG